MSPPSFDSRWTDHNADCCVNTVDEKNTTTTNVVKFSPVTQEILWLICMSGDCREANICTLLVISHSLGASSIASL